MNIIAALRSKVFEILQVIRLHSALSQSNMQVHNLRKAGDGRYLIRVSSNGQPIKGSKGSSFSDAGLFGGFGGRERMANEHEFGDYFAAGAPLALSAEAGNGSMEDLVAFTEFNVERKISTRRAADWGLRAMLRSLGCDVDEAETISDGGYGSQWIAVAFAPA
jgi:hypothetical protein